MKILITGSSGFIGQNLCQKLEKEYKLVELFKWTRKNTLEEIEKFQPNMIFHFAAELKDDSKMFESNVVLTHQLLEITKKLPMFHAFVNIGSSSEYGRKGFPIKETDFLEPETIYEGTKAAATMLCQSYAHTYDLPIVTARPFTIYGVGEQETKLIPTLVRKIKSNEPIDLSEGVHDFLYIDDFLDGLIMLSKQPKEKIKGDVLNFGTGVQTSNLEVARLVQEIMNKEANINRVDKMRSYDSNCWVCNPRHAWMEYGWAATTSLQEGIKKYIQYERL